MKTKLQYTTAIGMIIVSSFLGFSTAEFQIYKADVQKAEDTLMSSCFEVGIMTSTVDLSQANGLTQERILEKIRNANTEIELQSYWSFSNTVGYTTKNTKRIFLNRRIQSKMNSCERTANIAHELMHKIGFGHDVKPTARRPRSVPYMVGNIVRNCCKERL